MNIEKAKEQIAELLNDPYPSGSVRAVKELFAAMLKCGLGFKAGVGKSGPLGVLDIGNIAAINALRHLTDTPLLYRSLGCLMFYKHMTPAHDSKPGE